MKPTSVRYQVVGVTTLVAVLMYLDRVCISEIAKLDSFVTAASLNDTQKGAILAAFFYTYAFAQVPAGWLADRLGARMMLTLYVGIWSLCTLMTGMANGFLMLISARLLFGVAQAGCYPTASSLNKRWIPARQRGTTSSIISFGGRLGGTIAPLLTAWLLKEYLGWRDVLVWYGLIGFAIAFVFWWVCRDTPRRHPQVNEQELDVIHSGDTASPASGPSEFPPILPLICSWRMWLMCVVQFGINVGWVFLITWMPTYLKDVRNVDSQQGGLMSTIVLAAGIVGMLCGGPLTDQLTNRIGKKWGRLLPLLVCYTIAAAAYIGCLFVGPTWGFVALAATVAFATDTSVPSIWAYMQDVGSRNTASVFGWGNMWGNLGAAVISQVIPYVLKRWDTNHDWHEVFLVMASGFLVAAIASLGLNATEPVERE